MYFVEYEYNRHCLTTTISINIYDVLIVNTIYIYMSILWVILPGAVGGRLPTAVDGRFPLADAVLNNDGIDR